MALRPSLPPGEPYIRVMARSTNTLCLSTALVKNRDETDSAENGYGLTLLAPGEFEMGHIRCGNRPHQPETVEIAEAFE